MSTLPSGAYLFRPKRLSTHGATALYFSFIYIILAPLVLVCVVAMLKKLIPAGWKDGLREFLRRFMSLLGSNTRNPL